jgi:hypothetical protein
VALVVFIVAIGTVVAVQNSRMLNAAAPAPTTTTTTTATTTTTSPPHAVAGTAHAAVEPPPAIRPVTPPVARPIARPVAGIVAENAKPGSTAWELPRTGPWHIEGYADTTSAQRGDVVTLYVNTDAPTWSVEAYRMGWYHGTDGRLVWRSGLEPGMLQPAPVLDRATHMAEARWQPSLAITIGSDWVPGAYLLVLRSGLGGGHYVPLTIRDDESRAALVIVDAVTTWQAYNPWGGCSLYHCPTFKGASRATVVSFDRPYAHTYNLGSADFIDHELPLIALAEQLGLDVTYVTDVDLDRDPSLVRRHRALVSLGHDEYYSTAMRQALISGRDAGVNLAFLGANAMYRHIRLEPDDQGRARRQEVNYRSLQDPIAKSDPAEATVQWRNGPDPRPEEAIMGAQYACSPVSAAMRLVDTTSWVFAGTGAMSGEMLRHVVANEYDRVFRASYMPRNLEVLAHSPLTCQGHADHADMTYYSASSGAGVFDAGSIHWICTLNGLCPSSPTAERIADRITENVLRAFAAGPAGRTHPSRPNVAKIIGSARNIPVPTGAD